MMIIYDDHDPGRCSFVRLTKRQGWSIGRFRDSHITILFPVSLSTGQPFFFSVPPPPPRAQGHMRFVGELYKVELLKERHVHAVRKK